MAYGRRHDDPPPDPLTDIWHFEVPDLTEWEHGQVLKGLKELEQTSGVKKLAEKLQFSERKVGHPRPLASLPWEKAQARGCSEVDLFYDLAHGEDAV